MDVKNILTGLFDRLSGLRVERPTAGTKFRLMGMVADIAEVAQACVEHVRDYFWKPSAMAVIFCVCRDRYCYADNMSQFERDFQCQEGLLSSTFRNNPYMRLPVDKWKENGAKDRVLRLANAYENAVQKRLSE